MIQAIFVAPPAEVGSTWDRPGVPTPGLRSSLQAHLASLSGLSWSPGSRSERQVPAICGLTSLGPCTYPIRLSSLCGFPLGSAPCPQPGLWPWASPRAPPERFWEDIDF